MNSKGQRIAVQDKTIARLYQAMSLDQRIEANEKVIQLFGETLNYETAQQLIDIAKVQALEELQEERYPVPNSYPVGGHE